MPPKDKKFVNPLLRSTEPSTEPNTETPTQENTETLMKAATQAPTSTDTSATTSTYTYTSIEDTEDQVVERRKRGKQAFDKTHIRWTMWIKKGLKKKIEKLSKDQELSLVALAEEAFTDLLMKYEDKK